MPCCAAAGWVIIKSHMVNRDFLGDKYGPLEGGLDPINWMGWCVDAYPYGPNPPAKQRVWGRTAPTMRQAIRSTEHQINELSGK